MLITAAEAAMSGEFAHRFVGRPILLLDVPLTSEAELAFVRSLCAHTTEVLAVVPAADEPTLIRLRQGLVPPRLDEIDARVVAMRPVRVVGLELPGQHVH
jgi:hypothetical protein